MHIRLLPAFARYRGGALRRGGLTVAVLALYALHQDIWNWRTAHPLLFGFLPIGLAYHAAFCLAAAVLMWVLTRVAWPAHLEDPRR